MMTSGRVDFQKGIHRLRDPGCRTAAIAVEGPSGSEHDAFLIAETFSRKINREKDRLLLAGLTTDWGCTRCQSTHHDTGLKNLNKRLL